MATKSTNITYISPRIKDLLSQIEDCPFTTITAPMGYGKSTAGMWYLEERRQLGDSVFRINIYSDDIYMFWKSIQTAFRNTDIAPILNNMEFPEDDASKSAFVHAVNEYMLGRDYQAFLLIDDCHLADPRMIELFILMCSLSATNLHIIAASRSIVPLFGQEFHLGNKLLQINADDLRLTREEMAEYCVMCKANLPAKLEDELFAKSEGWFSYIYLNVCNYINTGSLLTEDDDIYAMTGESLFSQYSKSDQTFIVEMCLAGEFTVEQADTITGRTGSAKILRNFAKHNSFVRFLPDTSTYRFHHILRGYAEEKFNELPDERKNELLKGYKRLGFFGRVEEESSDELSELTERELLVARLAAKGATRKDISQELFLSENTVRNYINNIYGKLNIQGTPRQKQLALSDIFSEKK